MKKKLLPVSLLTLALTACGGTTTQTAVSYGKYPVVDVLTAYNAINPDDYQTTHGKESAVIFNSEYGQFYKYYEQAFDKDNTVSERFAYQAIAEAKFLENGTLLPMQANGGSYAITRVVPKSITPCYWGQDNYRYHNALVKDGTTPLTSKERTELLAIYKTINDNKEIASSAKQPAYETAVKAYFSQKGYTFNRTYTQYYDGDPECYDVFNTYKAVDSEPLVNTYDGLVEYDDFNNIQPALAESWEHDEEEKSYTFKIREGATWVDRDGNKVADVKADDFVAAFQHMLDCQGGLEYLVDGLVVGAHEYMAAPKAEKDFSIVGVTCDASKNTVTYTLAEDVPYFMTMLGYSIFAPLSRSYYESKGGKFGADFDTSKESYLYAKDYSSIAYCGPYLIKTFTAASTFEFSKNNSYWNKNNINIDNIVWLENDGSVTTKAYEGMKSNEVIGCSLNSATIELAKKDGLFNDYTYISSLDANTYPFYLNVNRKAYSNFNDENVAVSAKTADQKAVCEKALKNVNIRLGLCFAMDRVAYLAQSKGADVAAYAVMNSYTPGDFVKLEEATTVEINGREITFPAGTFYGEIMQTQIDFDGLPMKVWNPSGNDGLGSGAGFDGWHNIDAAVSYFAKGVEQLKKANVEISASKPLVFDLTTVSGVATTDNMVKALGASIKAVLGDLIQINYVDAQVRKNQLYAMYYPETGDQTNCDLCTVSGWGPDYGDPQTYLDTLLPSSGGMLKCSGLF